MHNNFPNSLYTYQTHMSHIPYLKAEDARDLYKKSSSVHVLVLVTQMKDQNLLLTALPKYINLYINHNLTLKLKKILIPITQRFPKDEHTNLWLKTFFLTLELNPQSQVYHILFTTHFSSICLICKIQMGYPKHILFS